MNEWMNEWKFQLWIWKEAEQGIFTREQGTPIREQSPP